MLNDASIVKFIEQISYSLKAFIWLNLNQFTTSHFLVKSPYPPINPSFGLNKILFRKIRKSQLKTGSTSSNKEEEKFDANPSSSVKLGRYLLSTRLNQ